MCLDTVTDMNKTPTVPGDISDTNIDLGYVKNFHNVLIDYDNKNMYIPIVFHFLWGSAISMIIDEDAVEYFPKNPPPCGRSHFCAQGAAART